MRILLLMHPDFYDSEPQRPIAEIRAWLDQYAASLVARGHDVQKFQSQESPVRNFDWVHCFSSVEVETWVALRQAGCKVAVTPSLAMVPGRDFQRQASALGVAIERGLVRIARAAFQGRWPPVDEASFAGAVDRFLVPSDAWMRTLVRAWRLENQKIALFAQEPEQAALSLEHALGSG